MFKVTITETRKTVRYYDTDYDFEATSKAEQEYVSRNIELTDDDIEYVEYETEEI